MSNRLAIGIVAHARTELGVATVDGLIKNLRFDGEIGYYLGDDSGVYESAQAVINALAKSTWYHIGVHCEDITPGTYFCGASWNITLKQCLKWSDVVLWMEDDWELRKELDVTKYVKLLREYDKVGMIRLGHMAVGSDLHSVGWDGTHYLRYLKTTQYAYSGNPHLRHQRFVDAYGFFATDVNPGNLELDYDYKFHKTEGPEIWWPVDIGGWGVFGHIGTEKSYE